jgi:CRP/FNR family transcriptional regulator
MKLDPEVRDALRASFFAALPDEARERLVSDAMLLRLPAGSDLAREGQAWAGLLLVVSGLFKTYLTSPDGRLVTIRYARRGSLIGSASLFYDRPNRACAQALTDAQLLAFNPDSVRRLAQEDVRIAFALCRELSDRLYEYFGELGGTAFATLRQRVVRHLLDVASERPGGKGLVARLSQQDLADAVGSVREVVGRLLGKLREEGLVRTGPGEVEILDPVRLHADTWQAVTEVTSAENPGR